MEEKPVVKSLAKVWTEFVNETSLHGIHFISHKNKFGIVKILWICFLLTTFSMLVYNVVCLYSRYIEYDFETKTNVKFLTELDFPAITLCNTHSYDIKKVNKSKPFYDYLLASFTIHQNRPNYNTKKWRSIVVSKAELESTSFSATDTVLYATFNRSAINVEDEFKIFFPISLGSCFTYNGQCLMEKISPKISTMASKLNMYISINQERYAFPVPRAGITMFVHPYNEPIGTATQTVSLSPGNHYDIKLAVKKYKYLPEPHRSFQNRNCIEREDMDRSTLKYFPRYTYKACQSECITDVILKTCGCLVETVVSTIDLRYCNVEERETCVSDIYNRFIEDSHSMCECPHPCYETIYDLELSSVVFPARSFTKYLRSQNISDDYSHAKNNLLQISMSFKNLMVEEVNHVPKLTFLKVISDLGGYMGFFLGASVLTILELVQLIYRTISSLVIAFIVVGKRKTLVSADKRIVE